MSNRPAPPPISDPNPPRATRTAPPPAAAPVQPAPPEPTATNTTVANPDGQGELLASLLARGGQSAGQNAPMTDGAAMLMNLAAMRQQTIDPMTDYVGDGTRKLRWVQAAIAHYSSMTGRTRQDIERDALLGTHPIPAELLDAHYQLVYGRPRPRT